MRRGTLVHPRLSDNIQATGRFNYVAQVQRRSDAPRSASKERDTVWVPVPGMEAIPCMFNIASGVELKGAELTVEEAQVRIALKGYWGGITPKMRVALSNGMLCDIQSIDQSSNPIFTSVMCHLINPEAEFGGT